MIHRSSLNFTNDENDDVFSVEIPAFLCPAPSPRCGKRVDGGMEGGGGGGGGGGRGSSLEVELELVISTITITVSHAVINHRGLIGRLNLRASD